MSITDKQYLLLSQFSYNDMTGIDEEGTLYDYRGKTVGEILDCMKIRADRNYEKAIEDYNSKSDEKPSEIPTQKGEFDKLVDRYSEYNFATGSGNEFENIKDFKLVGFQNNSIDETFGNSGFSGSAFETPSGETIFAFRGTEPGDDIIRDGVIEDLGNLGFMGLVGPEGLTVNSQQYYARNFVFETLANRYPQDNIKITGDTATNKSKLNAMINDNNVSFTGHSLGGAIAAFMAYYTHGSNTSEAVTFNAPGMGQLIDDDDKGKYRVTDFVDCLDLIGNALIQTGETTNIMSNFVLDQKVTEEKVRQNYNNIFNAYIKEIEDALNYKEGETGNPDLSSSGNLEAEREYKRAFIEETKNKLRMNIDILIGFEQNRVNIENADKNNEGIFSTNETHPLSKFLNDFDKYGMLTLNHVDDESLVKYKLFNSELEATILLLGFLPQVAVILIAADIAQELSGVEDLADKIKATEEFIKSEINDFFTSVGETVEDISQIVSIAQDMLPRFIEECFSELGLLGQLIASVQDKLPGTNADKILRGILSKFANLFDFNNDDSFEDIVKDFNDAMASRNQRVDPLTLDLDGDGIETTSVEKGVYFDLDKNNFAEKTGWVKSDDGLLTLDRNNDGKITNGGELFGDQTVLKNGNIAKNGFEALSEFDINKDGKIDSNDEVYNELKVWRDLNQDGVSTSNELFSMEELEIKSINLGYKEVNILDEKNNILSRLGAYEKNDGTTHSIGELLLDRNTLTTKDLEYVKISEEILKLPDIAGLGNVSSLHRSMAKDKTGTLMLLVKSFMGEYDLEKRTVLFEQILLKWSESENVPKDSRGVDFDAKKLTALEKFLGVSKVCKLEDNRNYKELLDYFHSKNEDFVFAIDSSKVNYFEKNMGIRVIHNLSMKCGIDYICLYLTKVKIA